MRSCAVREREMADHEFRCPDCEQQIEMDHDMRETVLRTGCPVCGAAVTREQFSAAADRSNGSQ